MDSLFGVAEFVARSVLTDYSHSVWRRRPQMRGVLGRDQGKARLRGPPRQHTGVHRLHAAALCGTGPRAQKDRQLLLPLRLARLALRQGNAGSDLWRAWLPERDHLAENDHKVANVPLVPEQSRLTLLVL